MAEFPQEEWSFFGKHQHRFEPPDVYFCRTVGDVTADDMLTQIKALRHLFERTGHSIFWLADVRNMGVLTPEARKAAAAASSTEAREALRGSAVFGTSFSTRVVVTLLSRAIRVLNPNRLRPLAFVATEAEARAFLKQHGQGQVPTSSSKSRV